MHARNLIPLCAAGLLAACAGAQNTPAPPVSAAASTPQAPPAQTAPAQTGSKAERAPVRNSVRAAPVPVPTPDILIGLAPDALDKLLGKPNLVRRDGPAEVRLYRDPEATCTFHVFLYANGVAGQSSAVEYFEARNIEGRLEGTEITDCYAALVRPAVTS